MTPTQKPTQQPTRELTRRGSVQYSDLFSLTGKWGGVSYILQSRDFPGCKSWISKSMGVQSLRLRSRTTDRPDNNTILNLEEPIGYPAHTGLISLSIRLSVSLSVHLEYENMQILNVGIKIRVSVEFFCPSSVPSEYLFL
jgi:hypothetical protein